MPDHRFAVSAASFGEPTEQVITRWIKVTAIMPPVCFLHRVLSSETVPVLLANICEAADVGSVQVQVELMSVPDEDTLLLDNLKEAGVKSCFSSSHRDARTRARIHSMRRSGLTNELRQDRCEARLTIGRECV